MKDQSTFLEDLCVVPLCCAGWDKWELTKYRTRDLNPWPVTLRVITTVCYHIYVLEAKALLWRNLRNAQQRCRNVVLTQSLCFFCRWSVVKSPLRPWSVLVQNISQQLSCCLCTVTQLHVCAQEHICVLWKGRSYLMTAQLVQPQQFCWSFNSPGFPTASNSLFAVSFSETRALIKPRDVRNCVKHCFHIKFGVLLNQALQWLLVMFICNVCFQNSTSLWGAHPQLVWGFVLHVQIFSWARKCHMQTWLKKASCLILNGNCHPLANDKQYYGLCISCN